MISIIFDRIRPWYEAQLTDEQNGFRKNRGTTDGIFTVKRIHQISNRKTQPLYLLFVDLTAAFDHIPRDRLFQSIRMRFDNDADLKLFDILESPLLFDLNIDYVMRVYVEKCALNDEINFYNHKYRINTRSITRAERLRMRNYQANLHSHGSATHTT